MRHTRSRSSSRCRCPFSNLQPPPSRTGRSIYTRRATACACDVLNLTRGSGGVYRQAYAHIVFRYSAVSTPFPPPRFSRLLVSFALCSLAPFYVAGHSSQGVARRAVPMPFRPPAVIQSTQECFRRVTVSFSILTF